MKNIDRWWCACDTVTRVLRDGFATCGQCGGKDAHKTDNANPYRRINELQRENERLRKRLSGFGECPDCGEMTTGFGTAGRCGNCGLEI